MNENINLENVVLQTPRLLLRPWCQDDLDDFYEYASEDGVGQMAGWQPHDSKAVSQMVLDRFIEGKKTFAVVYDGKVIGSLGVERYNEEKFPELADLKVRELGFVLSKDYWGMGLMPEAVNEVIRYLFEEVGLDAILCGHFLWNKQSARVQEKCGFHHYAYGTYETQLGTVEDDETSIIYREEWLGKQKKALIINCSPVRTGATAAIVSIVEEKLAEKYETRAVCIDDYSFAFCTGCRSCHVTARCIMSDGVEEFMRQFRWADIIVAVSPSYWADVPGQFKAFIDRCTPWSNTHEPHATIGRGKKGYALVLRTGRNMKECERLISTIEHFYGHLDIEACGHMGLCEVEYREDVKKHLDEITGFCDHI